MKQLKLSSTILHASKEVNILQKNIKTKTKKQKFSKNKKKNKKKSSLKKGSSQRKVGDNKYVLKIHAFL